jgi:hypothetical protein
VDDGALIKSALISAPMVKAIPFFTRALFRITWAIGLALFAAQAVDIRHAGKSALPPRYEVASAREARILAGAKCVAVLGTGSMRPYIPASANPRQIVAFAATEPTPYEDLQKGQLVLYHWKGELVIHQIVARQGEGWISSGLSNPRYDGMRVTQASYYRRVIGVYIIKPTEVASAATTPK